jgi:hypothetical protein
MQALYIAPEIERVPGIGRRTAFAATAAQVLV